MNKIRTKQDYINSLKNRNLSIYLMGELVKDPLTHPIIKPSIEAMAETYALADRDPDLATTISPIQMSQLIDFYILRTAVKIYLCKMKCKGNLVS